MTESFLFAYRLVLVGGGFERNCAKLDHIYQYYIDSNHWEKRETIANTQNLYPGPRACFSCVLYEYWLYIFGAKCYTEEEDKETVTYSCLLRIPFQLHVWLQMDVSICMEAYFQTGKGVTRYLEL